MPKHRTKKLPIKRILRISRRDTVILLVGALLALLALKAIDTLRSAMMPLGAPQTNTITISHLPAEVKQWEEPLVEMSNKYNIDANFVAIIMTIESKGNPDAVSHVGAQGLMQVMPYTAEDIATKHLKEPMSSYDLNEPHTNIEFGVAYLAHLRDQFGSPYQGLSWKDTVKLVAAGYNGGPGAAMRLQKGQQLEHQETIDYAEKAMKLWERQDA
jgi:soluble lytic murein transglycosylase-like protein